VTNVKALLDADASTWSIEINRNGKPLSLSVGQ